MYFPKTNEHTVPFNRAEIPPLYYENLSELMQDVKNVSAPTSMRRLLLNKTLNLVVQNAFSRSVLNYKMRYHALLGSQRKNHSGLK